MKVSLSGRGEVICSVRGGVKCVPRGMYRATINRVNPAELFTMTMSPPCSSQNEASDGMTNCVAFLSELAYYLVRACSHHFSKLR